jgi:hypothetical protein
MDIGASIYSNNNLYRALGIRRAGRGARDRHEPCVADVVKIMKKLDESGFRSGRYPTYVRAGQQGGKFFILNSVLTVAVTVGQEVLVITGPLISDDKEGDNDMTKHPNQATAPNNKAGNDRVEFRSI